MNFGVMLIGKTPESSDNIVGMQAFMIYADLFEGSFAGDTKIPLLRCFFSISKPKARGNISTGQ